ncbi:TlpA family protein disulfide reductase [Sulfurovum sp. XGS-02]|uniref:TlpA family protein disulfide reductase n=1 Tax=Sulfurovum sp. XGS-02 TaxID=2925411 RepID=UPI00205ACC36|nr:TlpA disulfide reductase family protein [Sulfurovum sp. XGS-02]UPT77922.1 TlpA family protein disulfide reductase [Sulfurovum sp. XGS-02]
MKKLFTISLLLLSLFTYAHAAEDKRYLAEMTMTDIMGKTYDVSGTEQGLNIKGLEGKVIFLEFFGHKCPPCLASIPHLIKLQEKYKETLAIVSIEVQGYTHEEVKAFAKEKGMNYIVVSEEKAPELVNYIQQRAQWRGSIPFLVAMDTKGDVQFVQAGMLPEASLEELISQLSKTAK